MSTFLTFLVSGLAVGATFALIGSGFVVVHTVLAVVSIGLAAWAVLADRASRSVAHTDALTASQEDMS